jgi:hypothetical protein
VGSLFESAGLISGGWYPLGSPGENSIREFVRLIGPTLDGTNPEVAGIAGDGPYSSVRFVPNLDFHSASGVPGYHVECPPSATLLYGNDTAYDTTGNWLVVVPEPGTVTVLVLGYVLLGIKSGRRRGRNF